MAKIIQTRIKNRFDYLENWKQNDVELLPGEIALVSVTTKETDEAGNIVNVPAVLAKVGAFKKDNGGQLIEAPNSDTTSKNVALNPADGKRYYTESFSNLPWLSAKASDVYAWAKTENPGDIAVKSAAINGATKALANWLEQIESNANNIEALQGAIANGTHYCGTTTTELTDGATNSSIVVGGKTITPSNGDIVIYGEKEFICAVTDSGGTKSYLWEELGDLTRVGALETLVGSLSADAATANQFVTHIAEENGAYVVKTARPTISDVKYNDANSLAEHLDTLAVKSDLNVSDPASAGYTSDFEFISSITQVDGKINPTKHKIPVAGINSAGIVSLSDATNNGSNKQAATASAVKETYDVAVDAQDRVEAVESNYMRYESTPGTTGSGRLYVGRYGADEIIFDCGGASVVSAVTNIITFQMNDGSSGYIGSLSAIEGMTWREWVNSSYNTIGLQIKGEYVVDADDVYALGSYEEDNPDDLKFGPDDEIVPGAHYAFQ